MNQGQRSDQTRIFFIEMMGEPGSYDASVYDHLADRDQEGKWFVSHYGHLHGISIQTRNVCIGDPLPNPEEVDGLVLAGTYNSVHDQTAWQKRVLGWIPIMRKAGVPLLGICGSHQLLGWHFGAAVEKYPDGPYAGTMKTTLTDRGRASPLLESIEDGARFHYANREHVTEVPPGSVLLASSGKVPVAALEFGGHWYSTQFHPEATTETLATIWRKSCPELCDQYADVDDGHRLVENFIRLCMAVKNQNPNKVQQ